MKKKPEYTYIDRHDQVVHEFNTEKVVRWKKKWVPDYMYPVDGQPIPEGYRAVTLNMEFFYGCVFCYARSFLGYYVIDGRICERVKKEV